jgi:hypothetical protein
MLTLVPRFTLDQPTRKRRLADNTKGQDNGTRQRADLFIQQNEFQRRKNK